MDLQDKHVVVLGGSSGIGLSTARAAAAQGARVTIASSRRARVEAALAELPAGSAGVTVDLADEAAVAAFFAGLGSLDHLVYTAGETLKLGPLAETDLDAARGFFTLRYFGALAAAKHAAPRIAAGGSIVFTSGIAGARPLAGWSVAASICSAMEALTRALAVELAPIRVNIVSPGVVRTALWHAMGEAEREALYSATAAALPVGHVGAADEIAPAYLYAMRQTYGTGQTIVVDGGATLV
ncbi:SDR family oxidoreductase [Xanthobacter pseudotagetidis]|uniref:SDR family oxidoreductase n=1 Tax=Xanthobacter pseudotagetidis TaxID=3119911 RepID=UPI003729CDDC